MVQLASDESVALAKALQQRRKHAKLAQAQQYGGVRVELIARITSAQIRLQIDVGFGETVASGVAA